MILGLILAGMFAGTVAGVTALIAGQPVWIAVALYAGCGIAWTMAGAVVLAVFGGRGERQIGAQYPVAGPQRG